MTEQPRVAFVSGANRGIGYAVTAGLARVGMTVFLGARNYRDAQDSAAALRAEDLDVRAVQLDVANPESIGRAVAHLEQDPGRLDVLVNNTGTAGDRAAQTPGAADLTAVREVLETNVFGVIAVTEAMLPLLRRSTQGGGVNVSSSVGSLRLTSDPDNYFASLPGWLGQPSSKTALNQITVQLATQLRPEDIIVNAADPGAIATSPTARERGLTRTPAEEAQIIIDLTPTHDNQTGQYRRETGVLPW
ncbi:MAG: SDR family NAD(P)-dependent oxidoreductase [Acidimicrobiales bacterium]